ncbi:hypothetical protein PFMALIP_05950, partial [Plasmodium falciparum MaliPS096_E11]
MGPQLLAVTDYSDAKDFLDKIGEEVYKEVHGAALERSNGKLEGKLSRATFEKKQPGRQTPGNPCQLLYQYHTNVTSGYDNENPCKDRPEVRFSYTEGAECNKNKIRGSNSNKDGACAPYRRLHLCDQHLEKINDYENITNDTLLVDVCLAAKFEAESLKTYRAQYQEKYGDTGSPICTVLARSFADIGDIIRGKDLYLGNNKEKENLEKNLRQIFKKIYDNLGDTEVRKHYSDDDEGTENYYKLRNAWWEANRLEVWKAITCSAAGGTYFRKTCVAGNETGSNCRCVTNYVPTYFDYVPQYLRWFEEWAEDFCRKKKIYVGIVKTNCRGEKGKIYCSGDGFDCTKTIRAIGKYAISNECTKCSVWCRSYKRWLENQKQEFLKQKKKCENEISGSRRQKRGARGSNSDNNGYEKIFYEKLKDSGYENVNKFLKKLSDEEVCKKVQDGGTIHFEKVNTGGTAGSGGASGGTAVAGDSGTNDASQGTFYHSKYCEECPECGVEEKSNGQFINRTNDDAECKEKKEEYNIPTGVGGTKINVLYSGKGRGDITKKLKDFCEKQHNEDGGNNEEWECYYKDSNDNICKMKNIVKNGKDHDKIMSFNDFFNFWVGHVLNDSIDWRTQLTKCLSEDKLKKCKNGCNKNCKCYERWVDKKKGEWKNIKDHFDKQKDIVEQQGLLGDGIKSPYFVLEYVLEEFYFPIIQEAYGDAQAIQGIKKTLDKKKKEGVADTSNQKTIIDYLLEHEGDDAKKCVTNNPHEKCPTTDTGSLARSAVNPPDKPPLADGGDVTSHVESDSDEDESEGEDDDEGGGQESAEAPTAKDTTVEVKDTDEGSPPKVEVDTKLDVCETVAEALTSGNLNEACTQKYGYPQRHWGWKCIPSDTKSVATGEGGGENSRARRDTSGVVTATGSSGAICVPPRRRKLYVGKLEEWAKTSGNTVVSGQATLTTSASTSSPSHSRDVDATLREAFIQSAAVETFFLWHKYKAENTKKPQGGSPLLPQSPVPLSGSDDSDPQTSLQRGTIPPDFLRQMFYTLGDYRDICVGNTDVVIKGSSEEHKKAMETIQAKIQQILPKNGGTTPPGEKTTPTEWWDENGKKIWEGMLCSLTYKEKDEKGTPQVDPTVRAQLWDSGKNTPIEKYDYKTVTLKDESVAKPKPAGDTQPPTLKDFVKLPPFFRWLHEWGSDFCGKRKRMLKNVKKACREKDDGDDKFCSGDGHDCENGELKHKDMFADLFCRDCHEQCRKYRKWIDIKFVEYHKQENTYGKELQKLSTSSNNGGDDNKKFCTEIKKHSTAANFLKALKHCKDDQGNSDQDDEDKLNKIKFEDIPQTFSRSTYCETCPSYVVNCNRGTRGKDPCTPHNEKGKSWEKIFSENGGNSGKTTTIDVHIIDRRGPFIKEYLNNSQKSEKSNDLFNASRLFKGLRKQQWTCKFNKEKKMDVCKLKNFNPEIDLNEYTTFKVFLEYWIQDFIEGYYILKKKIDLCTENGENTCDGDSKNDCACVKEWVEQKSTQWGKIQEHFNNPEQEYGEGNDIKSKVKMFLVTLIPRIAAANDKRKFDELTDFLKAYECKCVDNAGNSEKDVVECLLEKLKDKIGECKKNHAPTSGSDCNTAPTSDTPPDDEEDLLLQETEEKPEEAKKNMIPKICGEMPTQPAEPEASAGPAPAPAPAPAGPEEPEQDLENKEALPTKPEGPPPKVPEAKKKEKKQRSPRGVKPPKNVFDHPLLKTALMSSTIMWSIGIGFAAFTYFFLK